MAAPSQPPATSFDVFISYSRQDIDFARRMEETLESYKPAKELSIPQRYLQVFRDESDFTGVEYFKAVDEHLRKAGKLVVICCRARGEANTSRMKFTDLPTTAVQTTLFRF
jgi:hypothetical protein